MLHVAKEGYELLNRKREVLLMEVMRLVANSSKLKKSLKEYLKKNSLNLKQYQLDKGLENFDILKAFVSDKLQLEIKNKGIMGVPVFNVSRLNDVPFPKIGQMLSTAHFDQINKEKNDFFAVLFEYITVMSSLKKLLAEVKKTQKRVKALEEIFIPEYLETIKYIQDFLEENDREEFVRRKRIKK